MKTRATDEKKMYWARYTEFCDFPQPPFSFSWPDRGATVGEWHRLKRRIRGIWRR